MSDTGSHEHVVDGKPYVTLQIRLRNLGWETAQVYYSDYENFNPATAYLEYLPQEYHTQNVSRDLWICGPALLFVVIDAGGIVVYSRMWYQFGEWDASGKLGYVAVTGVLNYVTGGWSSVAIAAFNATDSESYGKVAVGAVKAYYGADDSSATDSAVDTAATTAGETTMDWDWNFSSGEADVAFSDAQNVDFGFGDPGGYDFSGVSTEGFDPDLSDMESYGDAEIFNGTPEVSTNDFGTTWDMDFAKDAIETAVKGVEIAKAGETLYKKTTGQKATTTAKPTSGSNDVLSTFGTMLKSAASAIQGVASQKETQVDRTYKGQLAAKGGAGSSVAGTNGFSTSTIMIAGAALLVGALYLHSKG